MLDLVIYPTGDDRTESLTLLSASSDRTIRTWLVPAAFAISSTPSKVLEEDIRKGEEIIMHETSVNVIKIDPDPNGDGDLWTASADKTAKCLLREHGFKKEDTKLEHPDFVKDVAFVSDAGWVVTACRDEEVRVWDKGVSDSPCLASAHIV